MARYRGQSNTAGRKFLWVSLLFLALVPAGLWALGESDLGTALVEASLFEKLRQSFMANIIAEGRWRLILEGLKATLFISAGATVGGSALGGLVCAMRMSKRPVLQTLARSYIFLIRGMPVLLLLMLTFYVVFASVRIAPVTVAIIAFGINFSAYVAEMFRTGIEGVADGQIEAGLALGFTRFKTFYYIVLPQALRRILPVYRGEFMTMVKTTSIVGYIGVQDLTRAGDIIRSRTFEAFSPLMLVTVFYFAIIWFLGLALDYVERRTAPRRSQGAEGFPL